MSGAGSRTPDGPRGWSAGWSSASVRPSTGRLGLEDAVPPAGSLPARADRSRFRRRARPILAHRLLRVATTRPMEIVDLTEGIASAVAGAGLWLGAVSVHTRHTTTGLFVNEHEPQLLLDLEALFERLAPAGAAYAHDDFARRTGPLAPDERRNGHAHCRAMFLRASEIVHVSGGVLALGRWQRVLFVDFDGGQPRQVSLLLQGAGGPDEPR
ncbi:MAG: secondary thiamine-phosphate synthase enzyme YjbQ [Vicinamibacterales bacterium]